MGRRCDSSRQSVSCDRHGRARNDACGEPVDVRSRQPHAPVRLRLSGGAAEPVASVDRDLTGIARARRRQRPGVQLHRLHHHVGALEMGLVDGHGERLGHVLPDGRPRDGPSARPQAQPDPRQRDGAGVHQRQERAGGMQPDLAARMALTTRKPRSRRALPRPASPASADSSRTDRGSYAHLHRPPWAAPSANSSSGWRSGRGGWWRSWTSNAAISTREVSGPKISTPNRDAPAYAAASSRFLMTDRVRRPARR